jgi:hypothetical protein
MTGAFGDDLEAALYVGGGGCKTRNRSNDDFMSSSGVILAGKVIYRGSEGGAKTHNCSSDGFMSSFGGDFRRYGDKIPGIG